MKLHPLIALAVSVTVAGLAAEEPLPPGATRVSPKAYVYVDKNGKKKRVEKTPFGVAVTDVPAEGSPAAPPPARTLAGDPMMQVEEKGDTVTFRRKTPFGEQVWKKKRSELSPAEQDLVAARQQATPASAETKSAAPPAAAKTAPRSTSKGK